MGLSDITREAVEKAIDECDSRGPDEFLSKYGFGHARQYVLVYEGREYYSKAIVGAAHGYLGEGYRALGPHDFWGGDKVVVPILKRLKFDVRTPFEGSQFSIPCVQDRIYNRRADIHEQFGGQDDASEPELSLEPCRLEINGKSVEALAGETILAAARRASIDIPAMCADPRMKPTGDC
ncbi:MAG: (2Fe-2S)-binding protein, partial [Hyphomicrobiaceae bacterium]|nr:(2Fe-2S)-binding protein [Hyphomicrobiaceae bacterium]